MKMKNEVLAGTYMIVALNAVNYGIVLMILSNITNPNLAKLSGISFLLLAVFATVMTAIKYYKITHEVVTEKRTTTLTVKLGRPIRYGKRRIRRYGTI